MEVAVSSYPNVEKALRDLKINFTSPEFSTLAPVIGNVRSVKAISK